jgi:hypothetical protein
MAARLLAAGYDLRVWNRTRGRDDELVSAGAARATTPADACRDTDVAITMLTDPAALEEVLFGLEGVASQIPIDATVIDMSTVGPTEIASAAERLRPNRLLDAPVLGRPGRGGGAAVDPGRRRRRSSSATRAARRPGHTRLRGPEAWRHAEAWRTPRRSRRSSPSASCSR